MLYVHVLVKDDAWSSVIGFTCSPTVAVYLDVVHFVEVHKEALQK